jgi:hypothetical protein
MVMHHKTHRATDSGCPRTAKGFGRTITVSLAAILVE